MLLRYYCCCCWLLVACCCCRSLRSEILICYHRELLLVRGVTSGDTKPVDTCNCQIFFGNLHAIIAIHTYNTDNDLDGPVQLDNQ
jgi:hypothetical protein